MENNERPKRKVRKILTKGIKALLEKLEKKEGGIIIDKEEIMSILPHRGDKLLLDKVTITTDKVIGEFKVTEEVCRGHEIGGQPLFRGVDYPEMAAQILGIWVAQQATQHPYLHGKIAPLRKASFMSITSSFPGDLLRIEMPIKELEGEKEEGSPRIERVGREDRPSGQQRYQAIGLNISVWVDDMKKAIVYFVELNIRDAQGLAK